MQELTTWIHFENIHIHIPYEAVGLLMAGLAVNFGKIPAFWYKGFCNLSPFGYRANDWQYGNMQLWSAHKSWLYTVLLRRWHTWCKMLATIEGLHFIRSMLSVQRVICLLSFNHEKTQEHSVPCCSNTVTHCIISCNIYILHIYIADLGTSQV